MSIEGIVTDVNSDWLKIKQEQKSSDFKGKESISPAYYLNLIS